MRDTGYYLRATTHVGTYALKMNGRKLNLASATGFWYLGGNPPKLHLITNRHVCCDEEQEYYPDYLTAHLRHRETGEAKDIQLPLYEVGSDNRLWLEFPGDGVEGIRDRDIAVLPFTDAPPFAQDDVAAFDEQSFLPENVRVDAGDDVRILGCPLGLYDTVSGNPIVRNGIAASDPGIDYLGMDCFLIDAQLHGGISGSPVLTVPYETVKRKLPDGETRLEMGHSPAGLLGVLSTEQRRGVGLGIVWRARLIQDLLG
jgi:hypothetical protein